MLGTPSLPAHLSTAHHCLQKLGKDAGMLLPAPTPPGHKGGRGGKRGGRGRAQQQEEEMDLRLRLKKSWAGMVRGVGWRSSCWLLAAWPGMRSVGRSAVSRHSLPLLTLFNQRPPSFPSPEGPHPTSASDTACA